MILILFILSFSEYLEINKNFTNYYPSSIKGSTIRINSIRGLYLSDSLFLSEALYPKSEAVEKRLIKEVRGNNGFIHSSLAERYLKMGKEDIKAGKIERGLWELKFAGKVDPSNTQVPLTLMKVNFPKRSKITDNLQDYFSSFRFLDNKVRLLKGFLFILIIFFGWISLSIIVAGFVRSVSFLSRWVEEKIRLNGGWVAALLFSFFVWLPILPFFMIILGSSFVKMTKRFMVKLAILLIILPVLIAYTNNLTDNFKSEKVIYQEFKAKFDPYNYKIKKPLSPFGYAVKGIKEAKKENFFIAESLFKKGYEKKKSLIFLVNLSSINYAQGNRDEALKLCEKVLSIEPDNSIANLTIANIYLDQLEFEKASMYFDRAGKRASDLSEGKLPLYQYPPDSWLLKYIFGAQGLIKYIKDSGLYLSIILGFFLLILAAIKRGKDEFCAICNRFIIGVRKIQDEKMCKSCASKLSLTNSKSIRERLKRHIRKRSGRFDILRNFVMNLLFPGSAHFYKKRWFAGLIIAFFVSLLIFIYFAPIYSASPGRLQSSTSIGNNLYRYLLIGFYVLLIVSTWRLEPHGNGR